MQPAKGDVSAWQHALGSTHSIIHDLIVYRGSEPLCTLVQSSYGACCAAAVLPSVTQTGCPIIYIGEAMLDG